MDKNLLATAVIDHLVNNLQLAYAQIDPDLNFLQTSDNFSFLLSTNSESAVGQPLTAILDEFIGAEETLRAILKGEQDSYTLDYVTRETADRAVHYFNFQVVNLKNIAASPGLLLLIKDVTDEGNLSQRLAQNRNDLRLAQKELTSNNIELQQLNNFKSFLLSMMAHDMRTPLAAIRGYSELVLRMLDPARIETAVPKIKSFSSNILSITDQMNWLIRDLIDFDRAEKGLLSIQLEACDIREVIEETMEVHNGIIRLQELDVFLEINPPGLRMLADPLRMQQVINNLLGNAIKYTPNGGKINIKVFIEGDEVGLSFTDNDRGMTPEQLEALFQPYYRTKEAVSSNVVGSGLGLFIVESLIEAQNGRIEVHSEVSVGSTFTVYLPLATSGLL